MKIINLTRSKTTFVDDSDYEWLNQWKWRYKTGYVVRTGQKKTTIRMHRLMVNTPNGLETDHINGNPLDNRRKNLRIVTHSQNIFNKKLGKNNTSGFKGVVWRKDRKNWLARIYINKKLTHLGSFHDKLIAAETYNEAAKRYYGEYANLNEI